jgi:hypothetical protein
MKPRSINIFLLDGDPSSIKVGSSVVGWDNPSGSYPLLQS